VKLAKNKKTKKTSSVKIMKKAEIVEAKQTDHIINEFHILSEVNHPFVVSFDGYSQNKKYLYLFMEYVAGG
jgi:serine/threonine protein kinase